MKLSVRFDDSLKRRLEDLAKLRETERLQMENDMMQAEDINVLKIKMVVNESVSESESSSYTSSGSSSSSGSSGSSSSSEYSSSSESSSSSGSSSSNKSSKPQNNDNKNEVKQSEPPPITNETKEEKKVIKINDEQKTEDEEIKKEDAVIKKEDEEIKKEETKSSSSSSYTSSTYTSASESYTSYTTCATSVASSPSQSPNKTKIPPNNSPDPINLTDIHINKNEEKPKINVDNNNKEEKNEEKSDTSSESGSSSSGSSSSSSSSSSSYTTTSINVSPAESPKVKQQSPIDNIKPINLSNPQINSENPEENKEPIKLNKLSSSSTTTSTTTTSKSYTSTESSKSPSISPKQNINSVNNIQEPITLENPQTELNKNKSESSNNSSNSSDNDNKPPELQGLSDSDDDSSDSDKSESSIKNNGDEDNINKNIQMRLQTLNTPRKDKRSYNSSKSLKKSAQSLNPTRSTDSISYMDKSIVDDELMSSSSDSSDDQVFLTYPELESDDNSDQSMDNINKHFNDSTSESDKHIHSNKSSLSINKEKSPNENSDINENKENKEEKEEKNNENSEEKEEKNNENPEKTKSSINMVSPFKYLQITKENRTRSLTSFSDVIPNSNISSNEDRKEIKKKIHHNRILSDGDVNRFSHRYTESDIPIPSNLDSKKDKINDTNVVPPPLVLTTGSLGNSLKINHHRDVSDISTSSNPIDKRNENILLDEHHTLGRYQSSPNHSSCNSVDENNRHICVESENTSPTRSNTPYRLRKPTLTPNNTPKFHKKINYEYSDTDDELESIIPTINLDVTKKSKATKYLKISSGYLYRSKIPFITIDKLMMIIIKLFTLNSPNEQIRINVQLGVSYCDLLPYLIQQSFSDNNKMRQIAIDCLSELYGKDDIVNKLSLDKILMILDCDIFLLLWRSSNALSLYINSNNVTEKDISLCVENINLFISSIYKV